MTQAQFRQAVCDQIKVLLSCDERLSIDVRSFTSFGGQNYPPPLGLFYRPDQVGYYQNAVNLYENSIYSALIQMHAVGSAALSKLQSNPAALRDRRRNRPPTSGPAA